VRKPANGYELVPDSYDPTQRPIVFDYGEEGIDEVTIIGKVIWAAVPFDTGL
jgi:repressor LexA